jgi:hypothetical protein
MPEQRLKPTANAYAPRSFLIGGGCEELYRFEQNRISGGRFPPPQIRRTGAVAEPYPRAMARRSRAASGSVTSTSAATRIKACQTPNMSPARPNNTGAIAPEPMVPV